MYDLLIFDWDGTIIDSEASIIGSMQSAALDLCIDVPEDAAVRNIIGLGLPEAIRMLYPDQDETLVLAMRERYVQHFLSADPTRSNLFPGVRDTLEQLQGEGFRLAVATGKSRRGLDRVLSDTGLAPLFEITKCADETASKPDPCMLEEILLVTDVDPRRALMIGDTEYDLEMGQRAGIDTVAVSYGAHHIDRLSRWNPVLEVHQFAELGSWLLRHKAS
ncbi:HAD family hydrolase [Nitrincola sp. A-D6]|uniref:HAD-IIIA family hydrolase n=1 Tax=Nitrincola sp. A-D6 TaxID=1545442 RepID=UPI00051F9FBD|nr:HAD-IIIA family hydrolase [Nitrincola sp. A-D6]KGK42275.1 HAD family hydrolase [Nitrincola sp. A-D6]